MVLMATDLILPALKRILMDDSASKQIDHTYHGGAPFFSKTNHNPIKCSVKLDPDNWDDIEEKEG